MPGASAIRFGGSLAIGTRRQPSISGVSGLDAYTSADPATQSSTLVQNTTNAGVAENPSASNPTHACRTGWSRSATIACPAIDRITRDPPGTAVEVRIGPATADQSTPRVTGSSTATIGAPVITAESAG